MAKETGVERAPRRAVSTPKKKLNTPKAPAKATSITAQHVAKDQALLYPQPVLSAELQGMINEKWDACWPVSTLRPLALLDLLCYLLFIQKLEEKRLITVSHARSSENSAAVSPLSWNGCKDLSAQELEKHFTGENGIIDLIKNYGLTNLRYSAFLKGPLLLTPTARLLLNIRDIIKLMDAEGSVTKVALFEDLLNRVEIATQNGQVYAPAKVVKLITELMQPREKDVVWDPSLGNGSFLVNSALYIRSKNAGMNSNMEDDFIAHHYTGFDSDPVQLRIAAMNMILHGIDDPKLRCNPKPGSGEQPSLVLSNLFFDGVAPIKQVEGSTSIPVHERPEISLLKLILQTLKKGGRGAVIVKDYILSNYTEEIKTLRREIIENHNLQAVITLSSTGGSLFSGASILIFSDGNTGVKDKVWFYKMKPGIKKNEACSSACRENGIDEYDEMADIISRWKNLAGENTRMRTEDSFFVTIDEIKSNDFNLCFNEYRKIEKIPAPSTPPEISIIKREVINPNPVKKNIKPDFAALKKIYTLARVAIKKISLNIMVQVQLLIKKVSLQLQASVHLFKKRLSPGLIPPVLIGLVVMMFFLIFINTYDTPLIGVAKTYKIPVEEKPGGAAAKIITGTNATGMLSPEQIKAIVYDTTGIIHFHEDTSPAVSLEDSIDAALAGDDDIAINNNSFEENGSKTVNNASPANYTVRDTAFFHNQPDEHSERKTYLDPLKKSILKPIDEKNGFIYIVYTNQLGRTSKGWINKKDLVPLR
ncbi:N-6 DNA methylase [Ginsengibacter hankyongi]|uniref:site-specific DNA-methyltransferase (adenine-specific) n=1 Tax=Ginsengibacter hankyongi TaxID=2607284 RepID=A0A5J5IG66_9BACT|nr:N-6 DNA methylase [Ginsengibacter hankyongi]KAA9038004.1 N-6 DNA methylase [Ginsengibacter hankyongi]